MRYMVLLRMSESVGPPPRALVEAMDTAMTEAFAAGSMVDAGGLAPMARSVEVSLRRGSVLTVDGPYSEVKEVIGGYAVLKVDSPEEAVEGARRMIELHQRHWPGWEGAAEVRRISGPDEGPPA